MGDTFIIIIITARTKSTNFHEGVLSKTTLEASVWGLQTTLSGIQKNLQVLGEI